MEYSPNAAKCKVEFEFCVKSLSMVFNKDFQTSDVDLFPVFIALSKGQHRVATEPAKLLPGQATSQFTATWSDAVLKVVLSMERIRDEIFQSKKVKLSINIASEDRGTDKLKSLATVNFDLATLRLKFVDKTVREKKLLCLKPVKNASNTILSVELLVDINHTSLMKTHTAISPSEKQWKDGPYELSPLSSPEPIDSPLDVCPPKPSRTLDNVVKTAAPQLKMEEDTHANKAKKSHKSSLPETSKSGNKQKRDKSHSLVNLLKPTQNATNASISNNPNKSGAEGMAYFRSHDLLGILRVRIRGLTLPEDEQPASTLESDKILSGVAASVCKDGVYCIMSVTGGNTRSKSSVVPIYPNRPVIFSESESEHMFYTNQSRQLFVLCRKVSLDWEKTDTTLNTSPVAAMSEKDDPCIGAANFKLTNCNPAKISDIGTIEEVPKESDVVLSLQPKGSIQLGICFTPLLPRCRVTCEGVITILCASNLNVPCLESFDVSCTVKLDRDILDSTSPAPSDEYSKEGWRSESITFAAYKSLDLDIQLWAYSEDGTTSWCGICILPVSYIVPLHAAMESSQLQHLPNGDPVLNVSQNYKERLLLDLEPQGQVEVYLSLQPVSTTGPKEEVPVSEPQREVKSVSPSVNTKSLKRTATLRRRKKQLIASDNSTKLDHKPSTPSTETAVPTGSTGAQMQKENSANTSTNEVDSEIDLIQENLDLKREIEYLRGELKTMKSTLSEVQFYREKAEAELKALSSEKKKSGFFGIHFKKEKVSKTNKKHK